MDINNIYFQDCMIGLPFLETNSVDMVLCDMPYGTTSAPWDTVLPLEKLWEQFIRVTRDDGAIVLTSCQPFTSALVMSNPHMFKQEIIWEKERPTNIFIMKKQVGKVHENILVFCKTTPRYFPQMEERIGSKVPRGYDLTKLKNNGSELYNNQTYRYSPDYDCTKKYPRSVQYFVREKGGIHSTQKPVKLFEYLINLYSLAGDVVLDACMGSGTTAIACMQTGRNYIGFENNLKYFNSAMERIELWKEIHDEQSKNQ